MKENNNLIKNNINQLNNINLKNQNMEQTKNFNSISNLNNQLVNNNNLESVNQKKGNLMNNSSSNNSNSVSSLIINSNQNDIFSLRAKKQVKTKNNLLYNIKNTSNTLEIPIEFNINNSNSFPSNIQNQNQKENDPTDNFRSYISN